MTRNFLFPSYISNGKRNFSCWYSHFLDSWFSCNLQFGDIFFCFLTFQLFLLIPHWEWLGNTKISNKWKFLFIFLHCQADKTEDKDKLLQIPGIMSWFFMNIGSWCWLPQRPWLCPRWALWMCGSTTTALPGNSACRTSRCKGTGLFCRRWIISRLQTPQVSLFIYHPQRRLNHGWKKCNFHQVSNRWHRL